MLEDIDFVFPIVSKSFDDENQIPAPRAMEQNVGLIVSVSIFAVLFVIAAVGAFLLWWYKVRPYEFHSNGSTSSADNFAQSLEESESTVAPAQSIADKLKTPKSLTLEGGVQSKQDIVKRFTLFKNSFVGSTDDSYNTNQSRLAQQLDFIIDDDGKEVQDAPKKSIRFNEMVERIEIDTEPAHSDDEANAKRY